MGSPPTLQRAIQLTFQSKAEMFASPLNCSMEPGITYCTAYLEDSSFGALHDAFIYRLKARVPQTRNTTPET